jgi:hypothetical protein
MSRKLGIGPGGLRRRALMKIIKQGHAVVRRGERRCEINREGLVVRRLGSAQKRRGRRSLFPAKIKQPPPVASLTGSGWIAYGIWSNDSEAPVSLLRTTWTVPPPPQNQGQQAIMFFNGLQNSEMILQPVLQWGLSALGGGNYWAIASWLAGAPGQVFHRSENLVKVQPGDVLDAVITLTSGARPGPFSYNCQFTGFPGTNLDVQDENELTECVETLEAYGITSGFDYPNGGGMTAMNNIQVQTNGTDINPNWQTVDAVIGCGERAELISNVSPGGEIDLYY